MPTFSLDPRAFRRSLPQRALVVASALIALVAGIEWLLPAPAGQRHLIALGMAVLTLGGWGLALVRQRRDFRSWRFALSPAGGRLARQGLPPIEFATTDVTGIRQLPGGAILIELRTPPGRIVLPAGVMDAPSLLRSLGAIRPIRPPSGAAALRTAAGVITALVGLALVAVVLASDDPALVLPLGAVAAIASGGLWLRSRRDLRLDEHARGQAGKLVGLTLLLLGKMAWVAFR